MHASILCISTCANGSVVRALSVDMQASATRWNLMIRIKTRCFTQEFDLGVEACLVNYFSSVLLTHFGGKGCLAPALLSRGLFNNLFIG